MITGLDQDLRNTIQHNHKIFGSSNNRSRGCLGYLRFLGFIPLIIAVIKFLFMFLSGVFGDKNKHNDQPVLNIPAVEVYEKFTSGDFLELRNKNAAIYPAIFDTANMNQDRPLFPVALQYIMVERPDTSLSASINIINNTHNCSLKIYAVNNNSLVDFMVRKGDAISIKINENTLDFAIKIIENTKDPFPLIREMTNITLVSDSLELDMSYRTINFHNKDNSLNRKKIKPSDVTGLTLIVYSKFRLRNDASTLDVRNYMTFRHADWCVVPKRK